MLGVSILRVSAGAPGGDPFVILGERSGGRFLTAPIGPTEAIFTRPANQQTEDYVTGRFG